MRVDGLGSICYSAELFWTQLTALDAIFNLQCKRFSSGLKAVPVIIRSVHLPNARNDGRAQRSIVLCAQPVVIAERTEATDFLSLLFWQDQTSAFE